MEEARVQPYLERIQGSMDAVMGLSKRTVARLLTLALQPEGGGGGSTETVGPPAVGSTETVGLL